MKITTTRDTDSGTVQVVLDFSAGADTDTTADQAYDAVYRVMKSAERAAGTSPAGLRTLITE